METQRLASLPAACPSLRDPFAQMIIICAAVQTRPDIYTISMHRANSLAFFFFKFLLLAFIASASWNLLVAKSPLHGNVSQTWHTLVLKQECLTIFRWKKSFAFKKALQAKTERKKKKKREAAHSADFSAKWKIPSPVLRDIKPSLLFQFPAQSNRVLLTGKR